MALPAPIPKGQPKWGECPDVEQIASRQAVTEQLVRAENADHSASPLDWADTVAQYAGVDLPGARGNANLDNPIPTERSENYHPRTVNSAIPSHPYHGEVPESSGDPRSSMDTALGFTAAQSSRACAGPGKERRIGVLSSRRLDRASTESPSQGGIRHG